MKRPGLSTKRIAIDKTNASLLIIVGIASFIVVFSVVSTRALYSQLSYQSKVINQKEKTLDQINDNIQEVEKLNTAYLEFSNVTENAIGGDPKGKGDRDGENARIILDALPSKYDFPALATSLEKLVKSGGFQVAAISGTDDEVVQSANEGSAAPVEIEMPFSLEASVNTANAKKFMQLFERSIRPIQIRTLSVNSQESQLNIDISAKTYFQPEKKLTITEEVVK